MRKLIWQGAPFEQAYSGPTDVSRFGIGHGGDCKLQIVDLRFQICPLDSHPSGGFAVLDCRFGMGDVKGGIEHRA